MSRRTTPGGPARPGRQAAAVVGATVAGLVALAGGAWAYVDASGGGVGTVGADSSVEGILIVGNSTASIVPGQPAPLSIKLLNGNSYPVRINQVVGRVSYVEGTGGPCSAADFAVAVPDAGPVTVPARQPEGDGVATWPAGAVSLVLADRDQTGCLGRTVYLRYDVR
jgi:hypothetical protein